MSKADKIATIILAVMVVTGVGVVLSNLIAYIVLCILLGVLILTMLAGLWMCLRGIVEGLIKNNNE